MSNQHIKEFLDYYLNLKESPEYSVLLKGNWGAGKTWFLKKYLESADCEFLWASFNGVSSFSEIEDQFFEQLHPRLASKEMKLAGKIIKGLLKATVKIDWDDDGKPDASTTIQSPDLKKSDFVNTEKYIIVFDDLERSQMDIEKVLGYINQYVEIVGQKVICICNEEDILDSSKRYQKIREKVVGKVFEVKPELSNVLEDFLKHEDIVKSSISFDPLKEKILSIFSSSESNNLRVLKQALLEFDRLFDGLEKEIIENEKLVEHLFSVFLIFYLEVHLGNYLSGEITSLTSSGFFNTMENTSEKKKKTFKQYNLSSYNTALLPDAFWESILGEGFVPLEQISSSLQNSEYFQNENTPVWRKIWRINDLTDEQFEQYFKELEERVKSNQIEKWGEVIQIAGIYLTLNKNGLTSKRPKDIVSWAKNYLDSLAESGKILEDKSDRFSIRDREFWGGAQFHNHKSKEMVGLLDYYEKQSTKAEIQKLQSIGPQIIKKYKTEPEEFFKSIAIGFNTVSKYHDTPILAHVDPDEFFAVFRDYSPELQKQTFWYLGDRYKKNIQGALSKLYVEKIFLVKFSKLLADTEKSLKGKVTEVRFKDYRLIYLKEYIDLLKKNTPKKSKASKKKKITNKKVNKKKATKKVAKKKNEITFE